MTTSVDKVSMTYVHDLEQLGLSQREASLYLALADLGKATAQLLNKRTKIPRASIYLTMEALSAKGLVSLETKARTTYFVANPPSSINIMLKREQDLLRKRISRAERLSTELEPLFSRRNFSVPRLKFFEGAASVEGMLYQFEDVWYNSMKKTDSTWWGFDDVSLSREYRGWFEHMWNKFAEDRKREIKVRVFSNYPASEHLESRFPLTKLRQLPNQYDFSSTMWLMGHHLVIFSTREKPFYGYQIHDPVLAENLRTVFNLLWKEVVP